MKLRNCTLALTAVVLLGLSAFAQAAPTVMQAVGTTETLLLTPSWTSVGSSYAYTYTLANLTNNDYIIGFSLQMPTAVPVTGFTNLVTPTGWDCMLRGATNKVQWQLTENESSSLLPGQTFTFGFTSALAPAASQNVFASCQDSYGFSGQTTGPGAVPEPASLLALCSGLVGAVGLKLKKK